MLKQLVFLSVILLLFAVSVQAKLVAYYPLDGDAKDMSGVDPADGTLVGSPNFEAGHFDQAIKLIYANSQYVNCGQPAKLNITGSITMMCWCKVSSWAGGTWTFMLGRGDDSWRLGRATNANGAQVAINSAAGTTAAAANGTTSINDGQWHHVAGVFDGTKAVLYVDGKQDATANYTGAISASTQPFCIGANTTYPTALRCWDGWIDDVMIFNEALTQIQITDYMENSIPQVKGTAQKPVPGNKSDEISIDLGSISWTPGEYVVAQNGTHNVFFGTDADSVTNATVTNPLGTTVLQGLAKDSNSVALDRLEYAATYFWRVDEVNNPASSGTTKGFVWSFKTELGGYKILPASIVNVTSYGDVYPDEPDRQDPNSTCTGAGLDANDMHGINMKEMWLGMDEGAYLQYEFDKVYKFYDMLVWNYNEEAPNNEYFGAKDVKVEYSLDGENWTEVADVPEFTMATGTDECVANTTVMLGGVAAKFVKLTFLTGWGDMGLYGISEVCFSAEPTRAQNPVPALAATNIAVNPVLSWKAGRYSDDHNVYISTDVNAVKEGTASMVTRSDANYAPVLALAKTYYWRVDEVNNAEAYPVWDGSVWNFSTVQSIVVDNFEVGYGAAEVNFVWATWKDGVDLPANGGSVIGKDIAPPGLSTINHSGGHSLAVSYDNSGTNTYSQVSAESVDFPIETSDWSVGNPTTLTIWFRGDPNTVFGDSELYCKIGGKTAVYGGNLKAYLTLTEWKQWDIDLATLGVNLTNIPEISIGIRKTGATGGTGIIYLDDIQLTGITPNFIGDSIYFEAETMTLTGSMRVSTSTTGFNDTGYVDADTAIATPTEPNLASLATKTFTVTGGKYIVKARMRAGFQFSGFKWLDSFFVRIINNSGTPAATDVTLQTANGWVNWDNVTWTAYNAWVWVQVWNYNTSNQNVTWILPAGNYTIQFTYKDTGAFLDTVEILQVGQ